MFDRFISHPVTRGMLGAFCIVTVLLCLSGHDWLGAVVQGMIAIWAIASGYTAKTVIVTPTFDVTVSNATIREVSDAN